MRLMRWRDLDGGLPALVALVVGFGAMVPFMDTSLYVGPVAARLHGADLSFYVGFVVAAAVYAPLRHWAAGRDRPSDEALPVAAAAEVPVAPR